MDDHVGWASLLAGSAGERAAQPARICDLCARMLGVNGSAIASSSARGPRETVCATDDVATRVEDLQVMLGQGPGVDALAQGAPVLVGDLGQPGNLAVGRWSAFLPEVGGIGVKALFAFPLRIGAINVGTLTLHRDRPGELSSTQLPAALLAADAAALALLDLHSVPGDPAVGGADGRPAYRAQVHQATGMVQVQLGVTTEEALLALRARAFAAGRSVSDIAVDVVTRRLRFTPEDR